MQDVQHFILTRFNLLLWNKDKEGNKVRTRGWLDHRFTLFEQYCLPSIKNQTCLDFEWIVLFDSTTPEEFKKKIGEYKKECPQLIPVYVEPQDGLHFARTFREEVARRLSLKVQEFKCSRSSNQELENSRINLRVLTTYLDNDDALNVRFVEDLQKRVESLSDGTFISYSDGYQYYTDHNYLMQIHYPRNHFMSVVEEGNPAMIKTIYGYGSHYYIDKIPEVKIENVKNQLMWCEVIHEKNMGNDSYFLKARMVREAKGFGFMFRDSSTSEAAKPSASIKYGVEIYLFRYLPRYCKTLMRRIGYRLYGRQW